jgi:enoyl-CoA hydratase
LEALATRSAVPTTVSVDPGPVLPEPVAFAAYCVASQALANVARYARAGTASVTVRRPARTVVVEIVDDGVGGADPALGTDLRGLADRVEALGGALAVSGPAAGGTVVSATMPLPAQGRREGETRVEFQDIAYTVEDGGVGVITLNRPQYRNAQSYRMLDEIDRAFDLALPDERVRVLLVRGAGGVFSTGHDLGTPDGVAYREALGAEPGIQRYDEFKKYNLDLLVKWRNFAKPTLAVVEGYCIYAGWMLAACMDVVFAAEDAEFLGGFVEYNSIPWDIGVRRAKELCFESRFISADEAARYGFVNRVLAKDELERESFAWARRVAENSPATLRMAKIQMNKAQDAQGFTGALEDSLGDYCAMMWMPGAEMRMTSERRLRTVDLAVRGKRGERSGLTPPERA